MNNEMGDELALDRRDDLRASEPAKHGTDWWAEARGIVWLVLHAMFELPFVAG